MHADGTPMLKLKRQFDIIKHRKIYYIVSILLITIGLLVGGIRGFNYGIDFTGGTMMNIDMGKQVATQDIKDVFANYGVDTDQMQIVYSGENLDTVIIKTRDALDNSVRTKIINDFEDQFGITNEDVLGIELFGPSVGKELQENALKAILLSVVGMLLYIRFRFREWKFSAAAILGDLHDILLVVAFYAIFQITVNNPFIAGILTVLGYSINDTIVIFDRVRENFRFMKKETTSEVLNISVNQTLTRSIMTSATTIVVMIPLFILAGPAIREFVMPLMVGILVGTMSSIFVCTPLYYEFSNLKKKSGYLKHAEKSKRKKKNNYFAAESKKVDRIPEKEIKTISIPEVPEESIVETAGTMEAIDTRPTTGPIKTTKHSKKGKKNRR
jgi:SecD/SecF fusion protein